MSIKNDTLFNNLFKTFSFHFLVVGGERKLALAIPLSQRGCFIVCSRELLVTLRSFRRKMRVSHVF